MRHTLTALAAAAAVAVVSVAAPQPAQARNGRIAAGIIGGLAAGALFGAIARPHYYGPRDYYGPGYVYGPGPVYYEPSCYLANSRYWNGYRWHWRRVRVCD